MRIYTLTTSREYEGIDDVMVFSTIANAHEELLKIKAEAIKDGYIFADMASICQVELDTNKLQVLYSEDLREWFDLQEVA